MSALRIPEHATAARLEGLLMRYPNSVRLKLKLQETRKREEQLRLAQERRLRGQIRRGLKALDLSALRLVAAELEQLGGLAS